MNTGEVKPSKFFYGIAGGVLVVGIVLFVIILVKGITSSVDRLNMRVLVPCSELLELNEKGDYTIYFEYRSVVDGKMVETRDINGLKCSLMNTNTAEYIELKSTSNSSNYSLGGRKGYSVFEFSIDQPGEYEFEAIYENRDGEEAVLAIGKGFGSALIKTILLCIATLFVSLGTSISIFCITLAKRRKAKDNVLYKQNSLHQWK